MRFSKNVRGRGPLGVDLRSAGRNDRLSCSQLLTQRLTSPIGEAERDPTEGPPWCQALLCLFLYANGSAHFRALHATTAAWYVRRPLRMTTNRPKSGGSGTSAASGPLSLRPLMWMAPSATSS